MTALTRKKLLKQISEAQRNIRRLAKLYPGCFDAEGRPLVAAATFLGAQKKD